MGTQGTVGDAGKLYRGHGGFAATPDLCDNTAFTGESAPEADRPGADVQIHQSVRSVDMYCHHKVFPLCGRRSMGRSETGVRCQKAGYRGSGRDGGRADRAARTARSSAYRPASTGRPTTTCSTTLTPETHLCPPHRRHRCIVSHVLHSTNQPSQTPHGSAHGRHGRRVRHPLLLGQHAALCTITMVRGPVLLYRYRTVHLRWLHSHCHYTHTPMYHPQTPTRERTQARTRPVHHRMLRPGPERIYPRTKYILYGRAGGYSRPGRNRPRSPTPPSRGPLGQPAHVRRLPLELHPTETYRRPAKVRCYPAEKTAVWARLSYRMRRTVAPTAIG